MVDQPGTPPGTPSGSVATAPRPASADQLVEGLRHLVDEEMHLLGRELEDSLGTGQSSRLTYVSGVLDEVEQLLLKHRKVSVGRAQ